MKAARRNSQLSLEKFEGATMDIRIYIVQFKNYEEVCQIKEETKVPTFLALIGHEMCAILREMCAPEYVIMKTLTEIKTTLVNYFKTKNNGIVERYRVDSMRQFELQIIQNFIIQPNNISHEIFIYYTELDNLLRDETVVSICKENM